MHAFEAEITRMCPFAFHLLDPDADVWWIVAGDVAVSEATVGLMAASIGDEFEIAYLLSCYDAA